MMQILELLRTELAPKPGRLENVLRITGLTVLVVIWLETFQIPLPAYSAFLVFFLSKEEVASTLFTGIIVTVATTLSVFLAIAIYTFSAGEPGLRLPLMAVVVFVGLFISRASPIGSVALIIGFLVTLSLTLIDVVPREAPLSTAESLTRSVLWLWVVVMVPTGLVILVNILTGRDPTDLFNQGLMKRFELAGRLLTAHPVNQSDQKQMLVYGQSGTSDLLRYLKIPRIVNEKLQKNKSANEVLLAHIARLITLLNEWVELKIEEPQLLAAASKVGTRLLMVADSIKTQTEISPTPPKLTLPIDADNTVNEKKAFLLLATLIEYVEALPLLLASRTAAIPSQHATVQTKKPQHLLLAPDAFSNPDYVHYALKTTLAIFIAYITYNLLDWPSIRTCMITCFFVSLGTFGETAQKMTLRMAGALIGGGLGLATIIFIMPYMTTITGLSLITAVIAFIAGWVATSSERLSYAGVQIALAFFFSILVGYGPTIDLTEARDRVVGVLLGNLIIFFVFTLVWPTSALKQARLSLAVALNQLSQMCATSSVASQEEQIHKDTLFFTFSDAISKARRLVSLNTFEPVKIRRERVTVDIAILDAALELYGPMIILNERSLMSVSPMLNTELLTYYHLLSTWLSDVSVKLTEGKLAILPLPKIDSLIHSLKNAITASPTNTWLIAYTDWFFALDERLNKLDTLIKKSVDPVSISLNQAIREST